MKRSLLYFALYVAVFAWFGKDGQAQNPPGNQTARRLVKGAALPTACSEGDVFYKTGSPGSPQYCSVTGNPGTWVAWGGDGGGGSPAGSAGACNFYLTSSTFGGDATVCFENITALATPAAPTLSKTGAGTGTTWGYEIVCRNQIGWTVGSTEATISGNATLDMTHAINVLVPSGAGCTSYDVYRTTASGTPSRTGFIGNVAPAGTVIDNGLPGDFTSPPSYNTTVGNYFGQQLAQADLGDSVALYFGTPYEQFTNIIGEEVSLANAKFGFAYKGTTNNVFEIMEIVSETDNGQVVFEADAFANGGANLGAAIQGEAGNSGTLDISTGDIIRAVYEAMNTGNVGELHEYDATAAVKADSSYGTVGTLVGFYSPDLNGTVASYAFRSDMTAGAAKWSFNSTGTAAFGLPSTVFGSLVAYASRAEVYCSDCTVVSGVDNTCAGSGTGANAVRVNGAWKCWQ